MRASTVVVAVVVLATALPQAVAQAPLADAGVELRNVAPPPDAQGVRPLTLAEAVDLALAGNLDLALAAAERERAAASVLESRGALLPSLDLGAFFHTRDGRVQGSFGNLRDVDFDTYQYGAALTYRVNLGAQIHRASAARRQLDRATYERLEAEQRVLLDVAEAFHDVVLARIAVQVTEQLVADSTSFVAIATARERAGIGPGSDTARAEAKLAADRQEEVEARQLWVETSARLATILRLEPEVVLAPAEHRLAAWELEAGAVTDERPDVAAARQGVEAVGHTRAAAWWDLLAPELAAGVGRVQLGDDLDDMDGRSETAAGLFWRLSVDKLGGVRRRDAELDAARLQLQRVEDTAAAELEVRRHEVAGARQRLPLARAGVVAAERNLRISSTRFKGGTAIALEVFDAQNTLARARLALAATIVDLNLAQVRHLAASGTLAPSHLR